MRINLVMNQLSKLIKGEGAYMTYQLQQHKYKGNEKPAQEKSAVSLSIRIQQAIIPAKSLHIQPLLNPTGGKCRNQEKSFNIITYFINLFSNSVFDPTIFPNYIFNYTIFLIFTKLH